MTRQRSDWTASKLVGVMTVALVLLFAIRFAGSIAAQDTGKLKPDNPPLRGTVELEHSRVYALVGKVGLGHEHGVVGKLKSGRIDWNSQSHTGDLGSLVFDMTSFDADTPEARRYVGLEGATDESTRSQVNTNMRGSKVLDVQRHPEATFALTEIELADTTADAEGKVRGVLRGDFTLHGVTCPIVI
jgi:polyisoprenoid-binding protein YceI